MLFPVEVYLQADRGLEDMGGLLGIIVDRLIPVISEGAFQRYRGGEEESRSGGEAISVLAHGVLGTG